MLNFLKDNIKAKDLIIIMAPILISFVFINVDSTYNQYLIYSHYIALIPNTIFILISYRIYSKVNDMYNSIAIRIGCIKVLKYSTLIAIILILVYSVLLYSYNSLFYALPSGDDLKLLGLFILSNTACYLIEHIIMILQIGVKKNILYIFIPIAINFAYHFYFVPYFFNKSVF